jgi:hypothetical protein
VNIIVIGAAQPARSGCPGNSFRPSNPLPLHKKKSQLEIDATDRTHLRIILAQRIDQRFE